MKILSALALDSVAVCCLFCYLRIETCQDPLNIRAHEVLVVALHLLEVLHIVLEVCSVEVVQIFLVNVLRLHCANIGRWMSFMFMFLIAYVRLFKAPLFLYFIQDALKFIVVAT